MNTGIISYGNSTNPSSVQWPDAQATDCKDEALANIQPIVPWNPPGPANSDVPRLIFAGGDGNGLFYSISDNTTFQPLQIQWAEPTFTSLMNASWPSLAVIVPEDFSANFDNVTSFTSKWARLSSNEDAAVYLANSMSDLYQYPI